jgi:hypothetical protein
MLLFNQLLWNIPMRFTPLFLADRGSFWFN